MSQSSLLQATRDWIIQNITFADREITLSLCDVMPDGRPVLDCGDFFCSIHPGTLRGSSNEVLDVSHQINITATLRIPPVPYDRIGVELLLGKSRSLEVFVQTLIQQLHMNWQLIINADKLIDNLPLNKITKGTINKWVEPLKFATASPPRLVGADWFHTSSEAGGAREEGLIQTISFNEARRTQIGDNQILDMPEPYRTMMFNALQ